MSNTPRGLPLSSSHVEQIFPILTPAQINRIALHGHIRAVEPGEVLVEQGDTVVIIKPLA
jgi:thioredoxin reductase (NADPH)